MMRREGKRTEFNEGIPATKHGLKEGQDAVVLRPVLEAREEQAMDDFEAKLDQLGISLNGLEVAAKLRLSLDLQEGRGGKEDKRKRT